ncbi:unnamed protein product [Heligmosomoides polygyrus]|uniref:Uncharacterized protein n=1 Tax=Heligmosomoides polygyrus TaxID=6339 RepID=A0A3P8DDX7_HELPZ|nr:unnamed protein product [Heligmosomoides polygyrus]
MRIRGNPSAIVERQLHELDEWSGGAAWRPGKRRMKAPALDSPGRVAAAGRCTAGELNVDVDDDAAGVCNECSSVDVENRDDGGSTTVKPDEPPPPPAPRDVHPIHWQAAILPGDVAREQRDEEQYLANLPEPLRMSLSLSALALHSRGALLLLLLLLLTA